MRATSVGGIGVGAVEQARDTRRHEQRMAFDLQGGDLVAAHVGAAARHRDRCVPAQERQHAAKGVQPAKLLFELLIGCRRCHSRTPPPTGQRREMPA
jgi:hypothetical protein